VLVLGTRYGFVAKSGVSVTEEEFLEARKIGVPVLVFVQSVEFEPQQRSFLDRIRDYEDGYFIASFKTPHDLQTKVTTALHDLTGQPGIDVLAPDRAREHAQHFLATLPHTAEPTLSVVVFPVRQGEEYISPLDMNKQSFKKEIAKRAMFDDTAIFHSEWGYQVEEGREHVRLHQNHGRAITAVEIHSDGTIFWRASIGDEGGDPTYSLLRQFVINQDIVLHWLTKFWSFANEHYRLMQSSALISSLFVSVAISNLSHKYFGKWPAKEPRGMQMGMSSIDDPLLIPSKPMKVSRSELADGQRLAERFVGLLARAFQAAGRQFVEKNE
jgi:hypothetical protein